MGISYYYYFVTLIPPHSLADLVVVPGTAEEITDLLGEPFEPAKRVEHNIMTPGAYFALHFLFLLLVGYQGLTAQLRVPYSSPSRARRLW